MAGRYYQFIISPIAPHINIIVATTVSHEAVGKNKVTTTKIKPNDIRSIDRNMRGVKNVGATFCDLSTCLFCLIIRVMMYPNIARVTPEANPAK